MLCYLNISAGLKTVPTLLKELVPIWNAAVQLTNMDKFKLVRSVGPGEGNIIDLENAIGRNERGLDG